MPAYKPIFNVVKERVVPAYHIYENEIIDQFKIFNFLFAANGNATFDAVAEIIGTIRAEHERTRHEIIKRLLPKSKIRERGGEITQEQVARDFGVSRSTVNRWEINQTANGPENKSNKYCYYKELRTNPDLRGVNRCKRL